MDYIKEHTMGTPSLETFLQNIRQQIAEGEILSALEQVRNYLVENHPEFQNDDILYIGQCKRLYKEEQRGIIPRDIFRIEETKLSKNILAFLDELFGRIQRKVALIPTFP